MHVLAVDFESSLNRALDRVVEFVPRLVLFLVILVVGLFVAKAIQKILTALLQRLGFDNLVERGGVKQALSKSKYDAAGILGKIVYFFIFLGVLSLAFSVFGPDNPISEFIDRIVAFLPNLFVAVIALIIAAAVAAAVKDLISSPLGGLPYGPVLANVASLTIIAIGVFFALGELEIAPLIVGGVFYALLALLIVPPIIAFGVGGIEPAREAIRSMQSTAQEKAREVKQHTSAEAPTAATTTPTKTVTARGATPRRRRPTA